MKRYFVLIILIFILSISGGVILAQDDLGLNDKDLLPQQTSQHKKKVSKKSGKTSTITKKTNKKRSVKSAESQGQSTSSVKVDVMMSKVMIHSIQEELKSLRNPPIKIKDGEYRLDLKSNNLDKQANKTYWTIDGWHSMLLGLQASPIDSIQGYFQLAVYADNPAAAELNGKPWWVGTKNFNIYVIDAKTGEYIRDYTGGSLSTGEVLGINRHDMEAAGLYDTDTVGAFIKKVDAQFDTEYFKLNIFKNLGHPGWDELFGLYWDNWDVNKYEASGHFAPEGVKIAGKRFLAPITLIFGKEPLFGEDPPIDSWKG